VTLEDRFHEIMNDPKKRVRLFKIAWIASFSMLLIGAFAIVWILWETH
jgi:predicted nucleic acid-binding Zn ribbon protein